MADPQLSQVYAPVIVRDAQGQGADPLATPPPGVTPSVWATLSPQARAQTVARLNAQAGAPPPPSPSTPQTGLLNRAADAIGGYFRGDSTPVDETGGGLRAVNPPPAGAPAQQQPQGGAVDPGSLVFAGQGGPGAGARPGGIVRVPATNTPIVDPRFIQGIQGDQAAQQEAATRKGVADQQQAVDAGVAAADRAQLLHNQGHETQQRAEEQDRFIQGQQEKLAGMRQALASSTVDPDRWWKRQSTGDQIRWRVATVLGGFLEGYKGTPNRALDEIHRHIADDLMSQKEDIERKKEGVAGQEGVLAEAYRRFGNMNQAMNAAHVLALQQLGEEANARAAQINSKAVDANNALFQAKLAEEQKRGLAALYHYTPAHAVATGGAGGISAKDQGRIFRDASGQAYVARTEDGRKKLAASAAAVRDIGQLAAQYQQQVEALGASDKLGGKVGVNSEAMARAQQTRNELLSIVRKAQDDGVWKKSEAEMLEQSLSSPDALLSSNGPAQAAAIAQQAAKAHAHLMQSEDVLPVQTGWGTNAKGELEPRAGYTGQNYQAPPTVNYRPVQ